MCENTLCIIGGSGCKSSKFSLGIGGMPYWMFLHAGYVIHGSSTIRSTGGHGCIRSFPEDAKWLNRHFIELLSHSEKGMIVTIETL